MSINARSKFLTYEFYAYGKVFTATYFPIAHLYLNKQLYNKYYSIFINIICWNKQPVTKKLFMKKLLLMNASSTEMLFQWRTTVVHCLMSNETFYYKTYFLYCLFETLYFLWTVFCSDKYCLQEDTVCCEVELLLSRFDFLNINWIKQQMWKVYPTWVASFEKVFLRDTAVGDATKPERNNLW